ncbi:MAG: hypothetical protein IKW58_02805 [Alphaproteobacteria bacterium]|nr:hypothetical protein [Alphaproteobacteria bacterium]
MRKHLTILCLVLMLSIGNANNANALILDPTSLAQKITEWVGKIKDATSRIQQQVQQIEQLSRQGFVKDYLAGIAGDYLKKYAEGYIKNQFEKRVKETSKAKEKQKLDSAQKFQTDTSKQYYEATLEEAEKKTEKIEDEIKTKEHEEDRCRGDVLGLKVEYENLIAAKASAIEIDKAKEAYNLKKMECDEMQSVITELETLKEKTDVEKKYIQEALSRVGTDADPEYRHIKERIAALEATEEKDVEIGAKETNDEWDTEGVVAAYTVNAGDYKDFINKYFINDKNITQGTISSQTEMDRVMRDRRHLLINSAIHLLQVASTVRRDIPTKTEKIKELYDNVPSAENELKAISYFSASKLDNIRALHLYAKILTTKLQYMAAKDLLVMEPRRRISADNVDAEYFDLRKYKLTDSYIQAIEEESNKGIDLHQGVSGN